ncbi:Hypothetical protein NTJ_08862 [Nesidiocoris tenuis]|uniref:Uncharacterized protein n=1 Tax=Nesidiocoris tenuis TaxID=355587 RepID=A0ABN7AZZ6_9HEMI|nr:Hypothetical protein NTJ_08862 [Nesidiocoris tenuis]
MPARPHARMRRRRLRHGRRFLAASAASRTASLTDQSPTGRPDGLSHAASRPRTRLARRPRTARKSRPTRPERR